MKKLHDVKAPDAPQQKRTLINLIVATLKSHGRNVRGVYDHLSLEELQHGGLKGLLQRRPLDGVRCEIGGKTITIEVLSGRQGEQPDANGLRFATNNYPDFWNWFQVVLTTSGQHPRISSRSSKPSLSLRADLRRLPHPKRK